MLLQTQSPLLRPQTTAHLAQTMTLLELTTSELRQKVEAELASNPALEMVEERRCPSCRRPLPGNGPCPVCSRPQTLSNEAPIVFTSPREDLYQSSGSRMVEAEPDEDWVAAIEDLPTYVLRQIAPELDPADRKLAAHILTSLDEDGLLRVPLFEIARYNHTTLQRLENVLHLIQHAEPVGVGCLNPQGALLVQLEVLSESRPVPPQAKRAILDGMDLLSRRAFPELGRLLGISSRQAQLLGTFLSENLNPYPARAHWGEMHSDSNTPNVYHTPDVIISLLHDNPSSALVVEILSPYAGTLRINPLFKEALTEAPKDKMEQWQAHLEQANLLVKCLQQRDHTLVRLMQRLVVMQREFILHGDAYLQPVTRAQIAEELDVHESTVSRAVSEKAVQLPNGRMIPMSKLFDRSLHIRTALRQIIAGEDRPLSDTQLAGLLKLQGYPVARRTVAKYRAMEGILPARYRQIRPSI